MIRWFTSRAAACRCSSCWLRAIDRTSDPMIGTLSKLVWIVASRVWLDAVPSAAPTSTPAVETTIGLRTVNVAAPRE
jgi:hypothetical protein